MARARSIALVAAMLGCGAAASSKHDAPRPAIAPIEVVEEDDATPSATMQGNTILPGGLVDFDVNSAKLRPTSDAALTAIGDVLLANPTADEVVIVDEAGPVGGSAYLIKLSLERALSIRRWLVEHGVPESRLRATGLGAYCLPPNATSPASNGNRVTLVIVTVSGAPTGATCGCSVAAMNNVKCP
jgi:outer membrane protein OmpA-like peptidoglycan-associated protein